MDTSPKTMSTPHPAFTRAIIYKIYVKAENEAVTKLAQTCRLFWGVAEKHCYDNMVFIGGRQDRPPRRYTAEEDAEARRIFDSGLPYPPGWTGPMYW